MNIWDNTHRVYRARHGFGPEARDRTVGPLDAVDADLLRRRARRVSWQVVEGLDGDGRMGSRKHRVGQIAGMRHVMHPQVKPDDAVSLVNHVLLGHRERLSTSQ